MWCSNYQPAYWVKESLGYGINAQNELVWLKNVAALPADYTPRTLRFLQHLMHLNRLRSSVLGGKNKYDIFELV
jgi:hypothetical protein